MQEAVILLLGRSRDDLSPRVLDNLKLMIKYVDIMTGGEWKIKLKCVFGYGNITWARNIICTEALGVYPNAETFILWDDDQIGIGDDTLLKLLNHNEDIVGTLVPSRWIPTLETHIYRDKPLKVDLLQDKAIELFPGDLYKVCNRREFTGSGVVAIKRYVFDGMIEKGIVNEWQRDNSCIYDFFCHTTVPLEQMVGIDDLWRLERKQYKEAIETGSWQKSEKRKIERRLVLIEEFAFFIKATQSGFRLFVDPSVIIGHLGKYIYTVADIGNVNNGHRTYLPRYMEFGNGGSHQMNEEDKV